MQMLVEWWNIKMMQEISYSIQILTIILGWPIPKMGPFPAYHGFTHFHPTEQQMPWRWQFNLLYDDPQNQFFGISFSIRQALLTSTFLQFWLKVLGGRCHATALKKNLLIISLTHFSPRKERKEGKKDLMLLIDVIYIEKLISTKHCNKTVSKTMYP